MESLLNAIEALIGIAVFVLMVGLAVGWVWNLFTGQQDSTSDFDTKDPGDFY